MSTNCSKYSSEFTCEAMELAQTSGKTANELELELGLAGRDVAAVGAQDA